MDGSTYVLKGPQAGRMIVTDHVAGILGACMRAPVGQVALVEVTQDDIADTPELADWTPGTAHASVVIDLTSDSLWIEYLRHDDNRTRFAHLAVLYGWFAASDCQYIYMDEEPHQVSSVDHGDFLPGGPNWTQESLESDRSPAKPFEELVEACRLTQRELLSVLPNLAFVDDKTIAAAVAVPPVAWNVGLEDRIALAMYLARRRDEITAHVRQLR